jgi:hypothetical protein
VVCGCKTAFCSWMNVQHVASRHPGMGFHCCVKAWGMGIGMLCRWDSDPVESRVVPADTYQVRASLPTVPAMGPLLQLRMQDGNSGVELKPRTIASGKLE